MEPGPEPFFLVNSEGKKIAVLLRIADYEQLMQRLEALETTADGHQKVQAEIVRNTDAATESKPRKTKLIFKKTEAEKEFERSGAIPEISPEDSSVTICPNNFYTKSIIHKPVPFEMDDEFCYARGVLLPDGKCFKVLAGSKASGIIDKGLPEKIVHLREELIMLQVLAKDTEHGDMVFTRDYEFDNPDDAASTIAAAPREGRHCWIATENGKPMRQY
ncbi:MAG: DUF4357 domain-containing protein [Victivallales bacterium]|nr:DUF4357 domain-containing protein [Victivallales bacterium]